MKKYVRLIFAILLLLLTSCSRRTETPFKDIEENSRVESTAITTTSVPVIDELTVNQVLRDVTIENTTLSRIEGDIKAGVTRSGAAIDVLKSAADNLQSLQEQTEFDTCTGGIYLWLDNSSDRYISFFAGKEPFQVMIHYISNASNESAVTNDPQLYLYLMAATEMENVDLVDLDSDGLLEGIVWPVLPTHHNIIIYDVIDDALHRIDVNESMDCKASILTKHLANIRPEYEAMVQVVDNADMKKIYEYHDGKLSYVCSFDVAIG